MFGFAHTKKSQMWVGTSSSQLCINSLINVNICYHEVYIRNMGQAILSMRRNFCVTTDRYAATVI